MIGEVIAIRFCGGKQPGKAELGMVFYLGVLVEEGRGGPGCKTMCEVAAWVAIADLTSSAQTTGPYSSEPAGDDTKRPAPPLVRIGSWGLASSADPERIEKLAEKLVATTAKGKKPTF
jgi:hypothetical protein